MKDKDYIYEFLEKKHILKDDNFVGVFFYGSRQNGTSTNNSDLDMIIVYKNMKQQCKCSYYYNEIEINYFKRSLNSLYKRVDNSFENRIDDVLSIIGYGEILFEKNNYLSLLKKYTLEKYKKKYKKLNYNEIVYDLNNAFIKIKKLEKLLKEESPYYQIYYGLSLNYIIELNNKINGLSKISSYKIYKVYNDKKLSKAQHRRIPNASFIEVFNNCVIDKDDNLKLNSMKKLLSYVFDDFKKIYRIKEKNIDSFFKNKEIILYKKEY